MCSRPGAYQSGCAVPNPLISLVLPDIRRFHATAMRSLDEFADGKLAALERAKLRRTLSVTARDGIYAERDGRRLLSFSCNDYLNLSGHPAIIKAAVEAAERYGVGAGASRLVTGNHPLYEALESRLARLKGTDAACVFGSGYLANTGIIPALVGDGDLLLVDELSHACINGGATLSGAAVHRYRHSDVADAKALLEAHRAGSYPRAHCHRRRVLDGWRPRAAFGALGACPAIRRLAVGRRCSRPRCRWRRPRFGVCQRSRRSAAADGHTVESGRRLWRLSLRVAIRHRSDAHPRPLVHLFDRTAAAHRRRRDRGARSDRRPSRTTSPGHCKRRGCSRAP